MGFKFRYESLLNYRRHLKDLAQIELARSMEEMAAAKKALNSLRSEYDEATRVLSQDLKFGMEASKLKNYTAYLEWLRENIIHKALEVAEWEEKVEEKREALLEKDKDLKIIDKLKKKDLKQWVGEREAREQKEQNEIAVLRHGRVFP